MNVSSIDHSAGHHHTVQAAHRRHHAADHRQNIGERKTDRIDGTDRPSHERPRGVIRRLEEGHFKGVADIRLRINFFEVLSSRAARTAVPVVEAETASLTSAVSEKVDALVSGLDIDEATSEAVANAVAEFEGTVQETIGAFREEPNRDVAAYAASLQAAFDGLITNLMELLRPTADESDTTADPENAPEEGASTKPASDDIVAEIGDAAASLLGAVDSVRTAPADRASGDRSTVEPKESGAATRELAPAETTDPTPTAEGSSTAPADEGGAVDSPTDSSTPIEDALAELRAAFDVALTRLRAAFSDTIDLSPPSEPSGRGGAYDKFLAIYHQMLGHPAALDEEA